MGRPDSGAIDRAVIAVLQADSALAALMPDGVYFNLAAPNKTQFVLVGVDDSTDEGIYGDSGIESPRYVVQAVALARDGVPTLGTMKQAAARIDALLDNEATPLATPPGYGSIDCTREERLAESVVDEVDKSLHWHHFGGYYRVTATWPE